MSLITYFANLLFRPAPVSPEPISREHANWKRQPWHGQPNYDLRIRLADDGASISYWRDGQTWKFWVENGQFGNFCAKLLKYQADPELDWGMGDTTRVLWGLQRKRDEECCGR